MKHPILSLMFAICCALAAENLSAQARLVHALPPDSQVRVTTDISYAPGAAGELKFDLYRPTAAPTNATGYPVFIFVNGIGADWIRHHPQYSGWGKLATSIGFAGITLDTEPGKIASNIDALVGYLRQHARDLRVNADHVVLYACSSNVTAGLPLMMDSSRAYIKAGVVYYGWSEISTFVQDRPLLVVRAGLDSPNLNRNLDKNVAAEIAANVPVSLINFPNGHHGFEIFDDNELSTKIVDATLDFVKATTIPGLAKIRNAGAREAQAAAALLNGKWDEAVRLYKSLLQAQPDSPDLNAKLGDVYFGSAQYALAVKQYQKALDAGNQNVGMLSYSAAVASMRLNDKDQAFTWLEKLKDIPPMRAHALSDPEFTALRQDPRFVQMFSASAANK